MAADGGYHRLRRRVTLVATAVVLVVLATSAWAVTVAQHRVLVDNLDEALEQAAEDLLAAPQGDEGSALIGFGDDDAAYQQVVDGEVVASSPNLDGAAPIAPAPLDGDTSTVVHDLPFDEGDFLVRSEAAGGVVVHVAAPLDDIQESTASLRRSLAIAVPVTTMVLGVALWFLVGRLVADQAAASRRQQQFVADASHELRGPLTRIRTELEVDLSHPDRADPLVTHQLVLDEALTMQRLVDDLLLLARADGGRTGQGPTAPVELDELALRAARDLRASSSLDVRVEATPVSVVGRREDLARALRNLTDNAARHATGVVTIEVGRRGDDAVLAVSDDGPGIPEAARDRVFERFTRLDEARDSSRGGAGLGLAIVREVVTAHGGSVRVDPAHHPGARLEVVLPAGPDG